MMLWQATPASLWQGRDDSAEAPNALRLFQTIARAERFAPHDYLSLIAPLTEGEHIVEAVQATAEECALLHIHAHDPCLLIRRRTWSTTHIVSHARLLFPGSRYRLQGRFGS